MLLRGSILRPGAKVGKLLYRIGHGTARHRFVVLLVWLLAAIAIVALVRVEGAKTNNSLTLPGTDSQRAFDILANRFPPQQNGTSPFVFHVDTGELTDPKNKAALDATYDAIKSSKHVYSVLNPVGKKGVAAGIITKDARTGFMPVLLNVNSGFVTVRLAQDVLSATAPARKAGITVAAGGPIGGALSSPDPKTSELLGNLAAMIILALVFGSLVAMGTPILTAIFALSVALSAIGLLGHVMAVPSVAPTLATMIGLGVGIDYALFLVTKHIEQLDEGMEVRESIARAVSSSGSAIVFAGGTVVIALASLAVAGIPLVSALGFASAIAVLCAVLAAITLLPAILSLCGHWVRRLRIPRFLRLKHREPGATRWDGWARGVARHPWIAVAVSALILVPLIVPLFSLVLGQEDIGVTPKDTTERQAYDLMAQGFGVGYNGPLLIAATLHPDAAPSAEYTRKYDKATALQKELKREQRRLEAKKKQLLRQKASLERQQSALERRAASLERRKAVLEARKATLLRRKAALEHRAIRLAKRAKPLVIRLGLVLVAERVTEREIAHTTDPNRLARLRARLARLKGREAKLRRKLEPIKRHAEAVLARAEQLASQAQQLEAQGSRLEAQAAQLQAQGNRLKAQGAALQAQANELQRQANKAEAQKKVALRLKKQLTRMLTKAGGDPRGTDPRIVKLQHAMTSTPGVAGQSPPQINKSGDAAILSAIPLRAPSSDATANLVERMRASVLPAATSEGGIETYVGGTTASNVDLAAKISSRMALVIVTVIALSFLLLLLAFRSLLVPVQAAVTNLLSVGAALGVLTAIFQWGWGLSFIGIDAPNNTVPIASYVPLMMFAVLFGLSMDYEVFLVSRIQQHHAAGEEPHDAVVHGLGAGAKVVTTAALIMFCVFASFVVNGDPTVKQFGVGLAAAVALAGTLVVLLAPALLTLFGRGVFWLPPLLRRVVPDLGIESGTSPKPAPSGDGSPTSP
jgi:uncharacterized membrane protein YdfJ with MMPL/SSD domain